MTKSTDRLAARGASPPPPPPAAPVPPRPPAAEIWAKPISIPTFALGQAVRASPGDLFGFPNPEAGADFLAGRAIKIAVWLRGQPGVDFASLDSLIREIQSAANRYARAELGTASWQNTHDDWQRATRRAAAEIDRRLVIHLGGTPDPRPDAAPPPPPPAAVPRKAMTPQDAAKVSEVIYTLHRHGVTFSVDPASGLLKSYDPRNIASPEDCEVLRALAGEARRVILEGHGLNLPSLPSGDRTRTIFPHCAEEPA